MWSGLSLVISSRAASPSLIGINVFKVLIKYGDPGGFGSVRGDLCASIRASLRASRARAFIWESMEMSCPPKGPRTKFNV